MERWFTLEDPTRLEPVERELFVETELDLGPDCAGSSTGSTWRPPARSGSSTTRRKYSARVRRGRAVPDEVYALVVWRLKNVVPRRLQLVYLGSGDVLMYDPVVADLERVERKLHVLWEAIRQGGDGVR
ncbi:RecB family exonuclease OS=Streptomyces alboniger OX=132473 GN=CP975_06445 PE=4 SV=1 [Streptomyces alboniger]